ncbi:hypothetical protein C8J57DRAFT_1492559 [Mycena rebaudengoi]|nr:hypothetical protein C8J57DRAFT_1492559 [Mycena rebaudengoi]
MKFTISPNFISIWLLVTNIAASPAPKGNVSFSEPAEVVPDPSPLVFDLTRVMQTTVLDIAGSNHFGNSISYEITLTTQDCLNVLSIGDPALKHGFAMYASAAKGCGRLFG